jgi:hydrogenase expression/formation protein HypC
MCLGIPGQITEITDAEQKLAIVNVGGVKRQVNVACIVDEEHPIESCVNDWVRIDEDEAAETLNLLQQIAEMQ